ncbi:MAG: chemotaxis protein CheW [Lysobacterales bacterium]
MTIATTQSEELLVDPASEVYGSFFLGEGEFALPVQCLRDVVNSPKAFTPQPLAPAAMVGIMTLRDMVIPVFNLRQVFDIRSGEADLSEMKVAVVNYRQFHIGMLFDKTGEVFSGQRVCGRYTDYSSTSEAGIALGAFRFDDSSRIVQVLNAQAIVESQGLPRIPKTTPKQQLRLVKNASRGRRFQSFHFQVGNAQLGICMDQVQEIVKATDVDQRLSNGRLLRGTLEFRDTTIVLIDMQVALKVERPGTAPSLSDQFVLVVRGLNNNVGLLVDNVCDIINYFEDETSDFPLFAESGGEVFTGCISPNCGQEIIQIDVLKLLQLKDVRDAFEVCESLFESVSHKEGLRLAASQQPTGTYLTFSVDRLYALPITDVSEVVDLPQNLLVPPKLDSHFAGILDLRGELISIANARTIYDLDGDFSENQKVLIFQTDRARIGLAVDSIDAIVRVPMNQVRDIRSNSACRERKVSEDIMQAVCCDTSGTGKVSDLLIFDLQAIVRRFSRQDEAQELPETVGKDLVTVAEAAG